jgi:hypothetical protein
MWEGEVVHAGCAPDGVVETVAALSAVAEDLVLHPPDHVFDVGADLAVLSVVLPCPSAGVVQGVHGACRSGPC